MTSPFSPSANIAQLRPSATIAVSQKARALKAQGRSIIDLGAGEPDFDTPVFIRAAAQRALDEGATKYTAVEGILPLRQAIADSHNAATPCAQPVAPGDVVVTTGSKQALFNACFALFSPGDEVLIPTPAWTSYYEMVELSRASCIPVLGDPDCGFKTTAAMLERAATPRTRGLMLNSPSNPTGAVYSGDELRAILELAARRDWWVISDEIYRRIAYDGDAESALEHVASRDRLVLVDGVAKAYAMTGWRIGWAVAPAAVARAMTALQSHTTSNATTVAQYGALAALTQHDEAERAVAGMVAEYRRRRDAAVEILRETPEFRFVRPDGAFYLYLDVSKTALPGDSAAGDTFAANLLERGGVAIVPGSAFMTPGWVRLSYAAKIEDVVEGVRRIATLWSELAGA